MSQSFYWIIFIFNFQEFLLILSPPIHNIDTAFLALWEYYLMIFFPSCSLTQSVSSSFSILFGWFNVIFLFLLMLEVFLMFRGPSLLSIAKDKGPRRWLALDVCEGSWACFSLGGLSRTWWGTHKYKKEFFSLGLLYFSHKVGWMWLRAWILEFALPLPSLDSHLISLCLSFLSVN